MKALKIIGILLALILVAVIILPFIVNVNSFRPRLESTLTNALGREVKVGNLGLSILSGSVSAEDLSIADDPAFSKDPFVQAKSLKVGVELLPLIFSKQLKVNELVLNQPEIRLIQTPGGKWNFSSLGGNTKSQKTEAPSSSSSMDNLSVSRVAVNNGSISLGKTNSSKVQTYEDVDITVKNFSSTSQFPFALTAKLPGDGDLKLDGQAGPIAQDAAETPLQAEISVKNLNLAASGFVEPSSGIGGIADFTGKVNSDGHVLHSTGDLTANKLKLAEKASPASKTVQLKYAIEHNLAKNSGTITQGDISIGKAVAKLTGSYQMQGETTTLNAKLNGDAMSVDELQAMLPALGIVPFAFVRDGKMLSIFWFLSQSGLSPIAHSTLARALIVWNSAVVAAVMASLYALHFFGKMRALPGTVAAMLGLLAFYKVGNPQYFLCSASLLIYFLTVDRDRGTLEDRPLLGAAAAYLVVLNVFQIWYQISGGSVRHPEVRAFIGLPAFVTGIVLMSRILSRELRGRPDPVRDAPVPA